MKLRPFTISASLLIALALCGQATGQTTEVKAKEGRSEIPATKVPAIDKIWSSSCNILVVEVIKLRQEPNALRDPDGRIQYLDVKVKEVLRGSFKVGEKTSFNVTLFNDRNVEGRGVGSYAPEMLAKAKAGDLLVAAFNRPWSQYHKSYQPVWNANGFHDISKLPLARQAAEFPIGWESDGKTITSVWAASKNKYVGDADEDRCSASNRPAFGSDQRLELKVNPVKENRFRKDDTIIPGALKISLHNPTHQQITVPALQVKEDRILWKESILFIVHDKLWVPADFKELTADTEAAVLKPGQTVSVEMPFSAQFGNPTIALGTQGVTLTCSSRYIYRTIVRDGRHPREPFQLSSEKVEE